MAIMYEVKAKKNPLKPTDPVKFYPTVARGQMISTRQLAEQIAGSSTVSRADVLAVLASASEMILQHLKNSNSVRLDDVGILFPTIEGEPANSEAEFDVKKNIKGVRVRFRPEVSLKKAVQDADFEKVNIQRP